MNETSKILLLASILVCKGAFAMQHESEHAGAGAQESLVEALERQGAAYDAARNPSNCGRILYAAGGIGIGIATIALDCWIDSHVSYPGAPFLGTSTLVGVPASFVSLKKAFCTERENSANKLKLLQGKIDKSNLSIEEVLSADKMLTSLKCNVNEKFTLTDDQLAEIDILRDCLQKHLQPKND